jgi:hypothetical protein
MAVWFDWNGDHNPTKDIISLPWQPKKDVWDLYKEEMGELYLNDEALNYSSFLHVWDLAFPHVRIHQYKQVRFFTLFTTCIFGLSCVIIYVL